MNLSEKLAVLYSITLPMLLKFLVIHSKTSNDYYAF